MMYTFSGFISGSQLLLIALIPFVVKDFDKRTWVVSYTFIASYIMLTTVYVVTICYLCVTLKKMSTFGDFSKEQRDILLQFLVFLLAFIAKLSLQALFFLGDHENWTALAYSYMQCISHLFVDIMPVTYMLYSHRRTYRQPKQLELSLE